MSAGRTDDTRVHLAAVHTYAESRPGWWPFGGRLRGSLQEQARARRADRVIGLVAFPEDDHEFVADDLVHLATGALHQRDDPLEVRVEHRGDLRRDRAAPSSG